MTVIGLDDSLEQTSEESSSWRARIAISMLSATILICSSVNRQTIWMSGYARRKSCKIGATMRRDKTGDMVIFNTPVGEEEVVLASVSASSISFRIERLRS
jgi:hypothetical protein